MQRVYEFFASIWKSVSEPAGLFWANLPASSEFWSGIIGAVVGAVVGGLISYLLQRQASREARNQRDADQLQTQRGMANALLFKVIRIHSDFHSIHRHIEECFERAKRDGSTGEPWQFLLPLANFPEPVHFSPEEMGLVLGLKDSDVFNQVISLDTIHNSLVEATRLMVAERRALAERMTPDHAHGNLLSGSLDKKSHLALRPRMIEVNSLIDGIRTEAKRDAAESKVALIDLHKLLKERLGLTHKIEFIDSQD